MLLIGCAGSNYMVAQKQPGIFNSLAIGVSAGSPGIGIDLASPIGNHFALRAGVSFMPNFSFNGDVDVNFNSDYQNLPSISSIDVKGGLGRTSGELLLNIYPFKSSRFFICGGAFFGGGTLVKAEGHSDELKQYIAQGGKASIEFGDYSIPVDKNGNINANIKVASFRPYIGIGTGRAVPRKRIGFMFEAGVQFHKTPQVYAKDVDLTQLSEMAENDFSDIIDMLKVYPVIKFRLCGRIF